MARNPDPARKPELLEQILDYLLDKPLSNLTFRSLATALGVSTFTLVYHFGTRAQLVSEIVKAISARATAIESNLIENPGTLDAYFHGLEVSWEWTLDPTNRQLQRLEFEAAMLEALDPESHTYMRSLYEGWQRMGRNALLSFGLSEEDAEIESRLAVDTFYGIQLDLVINQDDAKATLAFERAMVRHRQRIEQLVAGNAIPAA